MTPASGRWTLRIAILLLTTTPGLTTLAAAQGEASASVAGVVTDAQGGVLPGVTVTLTGKTGSQTQVTDARGEFRFVGLEVGNYSLKAELPGFRAKEEPTLDLGIGKTIDVKVDMHVSGVSENVQVIASSINVDTTSTATDTTLSQELLFSMPISRTNRMTLAASSRSSMWRHLTWGAQNLWTDHSHSPTHRDGPTASSARGPCRSLWQTS